MQNRYIEMFEQSQIKDRQIPQFKAGDTIKIGITIKEGDKTRIQYFEGICISTRGHGLNRSFTVRKIGANNGGKECDDFQIKTRNKSNISCCCRPKYGKSSTSSSSSTNKPGNTTTKVAIPNAVYKVRTGGRWLPEVKNLTDYAGIVGKSITDVAIKFTEGTCKYRVMVNGKWLPYVTGYNTRDYNNGYAGNGKNIEAVEVYYNTPDRIAKGLGYLKAKYRVSPVNRGYYPWQYDNETTNGQDGYAGYRGIKIDRFQLTLSK